MISIGFIVTSLIIVLLPGTGVLYTISAGLTGSKKDGIAAAFGCTIGIIPHLIAGIVGLSAIFYASSLIFRVIKLVGVLYLFYLGIGMLRDKNGLQIKQGMEEKSSIKIIVKAIFINLLNPKLTLFFFSFLPQFIDTTQDNSLVQMVTLGGIFMGLTFIIFVLYGLLAHYLKEAVTKSPRITRRIQQVFGCIFIGLAAKLALGDE